MALDSQSRVAVLTKALVLIYLLQYCTAKCPNTFPNGKLVLYCGFTTGDLCTFSCNKYFEAVPGYSQLECLINGEWNVNTTGLCQLKTCSPMPITNGRLSPGCNHVAGSYCSYECDSGFSKLSSTHEVECVGDDKYAGWNIDPHSLCFLSAREQCSSIMINGHLDYNCSRLIGQKCRIICDNYYIAKEEISFCNNLADWSPTIYDACQVLSCPTTIPNGKISFWCAATVGDRCLFTCNTGFRAVQGLTLTCKESGRWSPNPSEFCQLITKTTTQMMGFCRNEIPNGRLSTYCKSDPGDECYYYCNSNYEKRYDTIVCLSDGTWDKSLGQMCISSGIYDGADYSVSINVGIGVGGLVIILLICFVIFACFLRRRSQILRARESHSMAFSHPPANSMDNDYPAFIAPPPLYEQLIHEQMSQEAPPSYEQLTQLQQSDLECLPPAYSDVIKDGTTSEIADAYRHTSQNTTQSADYDNQAFALETVYELLQTELNPEGQTTHTTLEEPTGANSANTPPVGTLSYI